MNTDIVNSVAKAVLYEGYLLYPYRPSAVKNRQRFNFGVIYPQSYSEAQCGTDPWTMQTQCLSLASEPARCLVRVRFLRIVDRAIGRFTAPVAEFPKIGEAAFQKAVRLDVSGKVYQAWQEAAEEEIELTELEPRAAASQPIQWPFRLSAKRELEPIRDDAGLIVGVIVREQKALAGMIEVKAESVRERLLRLTVCIQNTTHLGLARSTREAALACSLVSAHTILEISGGEFVSMLDPPAEFREDVNSCVNIGAWPVLVGKEGQRDTILSSPVILYDYPQIAPESPGDLFDGAEIDEILSLRILTMTEEEKREMRESDERARQILERTENLPEEEFLKLHGAIRSLRPVKREMP
jgi:hypothetical protein